MHLPSRNASLEKPQGLSQASSWTWQSSTPNLPEEKRGKTSQVHKKNMMKFSLVFIPISFKVTHFPAPQWQNPALFFAYNLPFLVPTRVWKPQKKSHGPPLKTRPHPDFFIVADDREIFINSSNLLCIYPQVVPTNLFDGRNVAKES